MAFSKLCTSTGRADVVCCPNGRGLPLHIGTAHLFAGQTDYEFFECEDGSIFVRMRELELHVEL